MEGQDACDAGEEGGCERRRAGLNFDKADLKNYLGGATFLEVFKAWELGKKIFFYNRLPEGMLRDELDAMAPTVIDGNLAKIA
jgi:hypothetical protein